MGIDTFKSAKDYILIALMGWGVFEAREIKRTVVEMSISRAAEAVEREKIKQDILDVKEQLKEVKNENKEQSKYIVQHDILLPDRLRVVKKSKDDSEY